MLVCVVTSHPVNSTNDPHPQTTAQNARAHSHKIFDIPRANVDKYEINLMAPEDVVPMIDRLRGVVLQMQCKRVWCAWMRVKARFSSSRPHGPPYRHSQATARTRWTATTSA